MHTEDDEDPLIADEDVHECIHSLLTLSELIDLEHPSRNPDCEAIVKILEGTLRKNFGRLRAVHLLCSEGSQFADQAFEITRNMIEDFVNVAYLTAPLDEVDDLPERFLDFQWVQLKQDLEYYRSIGMKDEMSVVQHEIEKNCSKMLEKYPDVNSGFLMDKKGTMARAWLRMGVEKPCLLSGSWTTWTRIERSC